MNSSDQDAQDVKDAEKVAALIRALDRHIAALEADVDDTYAQYGVIPSQNQFFMYVSDDHGTIALQQDAAFVVESIMVVGYPQPTPLDPGGTAAVNAPFGISARQEGPGRDITFSLARNPPDTAVGESRYFPMEMFIPVGFNAFSPIPPRNADYFYSLPVEWLLPRGDVVKVDMVGVGVTATYWNDTPRVVLIGYKVF